jgi:hypothetical protein
MNILCLDAYLAWTRNAGRTFERMLAALPGREYSMRALAG